MSPREHAAGGGRQGQPSGGGRAGEPPGAPPARGAGAGGGAPETSSHQALEHLRREIAALDGELVTLLARRLELARAIGALKRELGLPVLDPEREAEVVRRAAEGARQAGVDPELVRDVIWRIMAQARGEQR